MALCLLLAVFAMQYTYAADTETPGDVVITGKCRHLFPAIMSLDYSLCRAAAWVDALKNAQILLPPDIDTRLLRMGLDVWLGRLALCSYAFPIERITPEDSIEDDVTVWLQYGENSGSRLENILQDPQFLVLQMVYISDTLAAITKMRREWPGNIAEARPRISQLENISLSLDALWQARVFMDGKKDDVAFIQAAMLDLETMGRHCEDSALVWFMLAELRLDSHLSQGALTAADEALRLCESARKNPETRSKGVMWRLLSANIYRVRALAHMQLDQMALAESDIETCMSILQGVVPKEGLIIPVLLAHAELCRRRHDTAGMCEDLRSVCAAGECQNLAQARRNGQCLDAPVSSMTNTN